MPRGKAQGSQSPAREVEERPRPIRMVRRRLETPDGRTVEVDVPVYPPFELRSPAPPAEPEPPRRRGSRKRSD